MLFLFLLLPVGLLFVLRGLERYERMMVDPTAAPAPEPTPPVANPQRIAIPADLAVGLSIGLPAPIPPVTEPA